MPMLMLDRKKDMAMGNETVYRDRSGGGFDYFTYSEGRRVFISSDTFWKMVRQGCDFVFVKQNV